uniref:Uncharacterized protein n=1 Tax=Heterorhabditis bacteriophora TaxID=37862 RepID=A0A1I7X3M1_HETBA
MLYSNIVFHLHCLYMYVYI